MTFAPRLPAVVVLVVLALAGCNSRPSLGQMEGTVRLKGGKPLAGVTVSFLPEPTKEMVHGRRSSAVTDDAGRYRLSYQDKVVQEGVLVGWHRVIVEDTLVENTRDRSLRPRVGPQYASARDTPLKHEVKPGQQTIDIEVTP